MRRKENKYKICVERKQTQFDTKKFLSGIFDPSRSFSRTSLTPLAFLFILSSPSLPMSTFPHGKILKYLITWTQWSLFSDYMICCDPMYNLDIPDHYTSTANYAATLAHKVFFVLFCYFHEKCCDQTSAYSLAQCSGVPFLHSQLVLCESLSPQVLKQFVTTNDLNVIAFQWVYSMQ